MHPTETVDSETGEGIRRAGEERGDWGGRRGRVWRRRIWGRDGHGVWRRERGRVWWVCWDAGCGCGGGSLSVLGEGSGVIGIRFNDTIISGIHTTCTFTITTTTMMTLMYLSYHSRLTCCCQLVINIGETRFGLSQIEARKGKDRRIALDTERHLSLTTLVHL